MTKADETTRGREAMEGLGLFQDFAWKKLPTGGALASTGHSVGSELSIVNR